MSGLSPAGPAAPVSGSGSEPGPAPGRAWPLWGIFCACSWTWIIGMYLPRIMLERYGWAGFLVFAVPNVLGCAALGYVLKTRAASERLVAGHRTAGVWFSAVTVAYHAYFAVFLATRLRPEDQSLDLAAAGAGALDGPAGLALLLVAALGLGGGLLSRLGDRGWLVATAVTYTISLGVLGVLAFAPNRLGELPAIDAGPALAMLAPVIIAGFIFCPYLDLTFHRAHQASAGTHAYGVFGLTFAVMLVLTCFVWFRDIPRLGVAAGVHLAAQAMFTVGAHLREIRVHAPGSGPRRLAWSIGPFVVGGVFAFLADPALGTRLGLEIVGEDTYLRFMGAYGLVFPAYAMAFLVPRLRVPLTPGRVIGVLGVCLVLGPFVEAAFLEGSPLGTLPALVVAAVWTTVRLARHAAGPGTSAETA